MFSSMESVRRLRRALTVYPAELKQRSTAAEVAGTQWWYRWSANSRGYLFSLIFQNSKGPEVDEIIKYFVTAAVYVEDLSPSEFDESTAYFLIGG